MKKGIRTRSRKLEYPTPQIGAACAALFVVMALGQLFDLEDMGKLIAAAAPIGMELAPVAAAIIVTLEVFAIPFLLDMRVSPLMRGVSIASGAVALLGWLAIAVYNVWNLSTAPGNLGLLGDHIIVPSGWWLVIFMTGFGLLFSWYTGKYFASRR